MFLAVILVPELFRKLRETPGNNFHLVSSKSKRGCSSYDQKLKNSATENMFHCVLYFGFLDITRTEPVGFGPDLVGILPMSLPQLSKQLRDQNHSQK